MRLHPNFFNNVKCDFKLRSCNWPQVTCHYHALKSLTLITSFRSITTFILHRCIYKVIGMLL